MSKRINTHDDLAKSIYTLIMRILNRSNSPVARVSLAFWVSANTKDSNLSLIRTLDGGVVDYIPKLAGVSPSANDRVLLIRGPGVPLTIVGVVVGDVSVAQLPDEDEL